MNSTFKYEITKGNNTYRDQAPPKPGSYSKRNANTSTKGNPGGQAKRTLGYEYKEYTWQEHTNGPAVTPHE